MTAILSHSGIKNIRCDTPCRPNPVDYFKHNIIADHNEEKPHLPCSRQMRGHQTHLLTYPGVSLDMHSNGLYYHNVIVLSQDLNCSSPQSAGQAIFENA